MTVNVYGNEDVNANQTVNGNVTVNVYGLHGITGGCQEKTSSPHPLHYPRPEIRKLSVENYLRISIVLETWSA
jgi:hypothetical protein